MLSLHRVSVASLTDHDTAEGVPSFLAACRKKGVRGVAGIEISSVFSGTAELHILGYRFNTEDDGMKALFKRCAESRRRRNEAICARLSEMGMDITVDDVVRIANEGRDGSGVIGRPHIAQALVEKGYVPNIGAAFSRYIAHGAPAFAARDMPSSEEAVNIIRKAGGLAVWAHPLKSLNSPAAAGLDFDSVLDELASFGLWGVECRYHGSSPADVLRCLNGAGSRGLYATAGTDFHGRSGHSAGLAGHVVEDDLLPWALFCGGR